MPVRQYIVTLKRTFKAKISLFLTFILINLMYRNSNFVFAYSWNNEINTLQKFLVLPRRPNPPKN